MSDAAKQAGGHAAAWEGEPGDVLGGAGAEKPRDQGERSSVAAPTIAAAMGADARGMEGKGGASQEPRGEDLRSSALAAGGGWPVTHRGASASKAAMYSCGVSTHLPWLATSLQLREAGRG